MREAPGDSNRWLGLETRAPEVWGTKSMKSNRRLSMIISGFRPTRNSGRPSD
jgi:hypothetical protein